MSRENNQKLSRRKVLQRSSVLAGTTTLGLSGVTGSAAASRDNQRTGLVEATELNGRKRTRAIQTAIESQEYQTLMAKVEERGYQRADFDEPEVYEVKGPEGNSHRVVGFSLKSDTGTRRRRHSRGKASTKKTASIGFSITGENVISAQVMFNERDVKRLNGTSKQGRVAAQSGRSTSHIEVSVSSETLVADGGSVEKETSSASLSTKDLEDGSSKISAQKSDGCWACTVVGNAVCAVGCSAGAAVICSAAGLAGGGPGIACGAIVAAFCGIIMAGGERYVGASCAGDIGIEAACYYADFCEDNPVQPTR